MLKGNCGSSVALGFLCIMISRGDGMVLDCGVFKKSKYHRQHDAHCILCRIWHLSHYEKSVDVICYHCEILLVPVKQICSNSVPLKRWNIMVSPYDWLGLSIGLNFHFVCSCSSCFPLIFASHTEDS